MKVYTVCAIFEYGMVDEESRCGTFSSMRKAIEKIERVTIDGESHDKGTVGGTQYWRWQWEKTSSGQPLRVRYSRPSYGRINEEHISARYWVEVQQVQ